MALLIGLVAPLPSLCGGAVFPMGTTPSHTHSLGRCSLTTKIAGTFPPSLNVLLGRVVHVPHSRLWNTTVPLQKTNDCATLGFDSLAYQRVRGTLMRSRKVGTLVPIHGATDSSECQSTAMALLGEVAAPLSFLCGASCTSPSDAAIH